MVAKPALAPAAKPEPIKRVSIIASKGSLEGVYPALIMANGARMEGIDAALFFTFFGLDAIVKGRMERIMICLIQNIRLRRKLRRARIRNVLLGSILLYQLLKK